MTRHRPPTSAAPSGAGRRARRRCATTSAATTSTASTARVLDVADPVTHTAYATRRRRQARRHRPRRRRRPAGVRRAGWAELPAGSGPRRCGAIADAIEARADVISSVRGVRHRSAGHAGARAWRRGRPRTSATSPTSARRCTRTRSAPTPSSATSIRRPQGVAGLITPWNVPFMLATWKLAPCLAAGCTVVLKPAELSPLVGQPPARDHGGGRACRPGVFNIVHGVGEEAGAALVAHPDVPGDLVHRRDRRPARLIMRVGGRPPEGAVDGARRQVAVHRVRRRRPRARPRQRAVRRVLAQRRALHRRLAGARRALDLRRVRRATRRAGVGDPRRRPGRPGHRARRADLDRALRAGDVVRRRRARRGRPCSSPAARRPEHLPVGNYLAADRVRRRDARRCGSSARRSSGRSCASRRSTTRTTRRARQRHQVRARRLRVDQRPAPRATASPTASRPGMLWLNSHNVRDLRTPFGGVKESGLGREGGQHSLDFYTDTTHRARRPRRHPRPPLRSMPEPMNAIDRPTSSAPRTSSWSSPTSSGLASVLGRHARLRRHRRGARRALPARLRGGRTTTACVLRVGAAAGGSVHRRSGCGRRATSIVPRRGTPSAAARSSAGRPGRRAASARRCG